MKRMSIMQVVVVLALSFSIPASAAMPKVMVMVDEKAIGSVSTSEIETMAVKKLAENVFAEAQQGMAYIISGLKRRVVRIELKDRQLSPEKRRK